MPASLSDQPPTPSRTSCPAPRPAREIPRARPSCPCDLLWRVKLYAHRPTTKGEAAVVRAIVLYDEEPDAARYEQHVERCRKGPDATFRQGKGFGAPMGAPAHSYYAEWEWPDMDAFKSAARSEEFMATGKDAMEMGGRFSVMFANVD